MGETNDRVRNASRDALKYVYYVIIGIAITEALIRAFISNGNFLGMQMFIGKQKIPLILLFAFLPTICRFVHGASIHLDAISNKRYKSIIDCIGFYLQAIFFYLMAVSLKEPLSFSSSLALMLFFDAMWLVFLRCIKYIKFDRTHSQWLISDIILIIILSILFLCYYDRATSVTNWSILISIFAIVAAFLDYFLNRDFYFPK